MLLLCFLIHRIGLHIIVEHFTVKLFFLLNMVENVSELLVLKFKNAGIIERGNVLFRRECVCAEEAVVLLFGGGSA